MFFGVLGLSGLRILLSYFWSAPLQRPKVFSTANGSKPPPNHFLSKSKLKKVDFWSKKIGPKNCPREWGPPGGAGRPLRRGRVSAEGRIRPRAGGSPWRGAQAARRGGSLRRGADPASGRGVLRSGEGRPLFITKSQDLFPQKLPHPRVEVSGFQPSTTEI